MARAPAAVRAERRAWLILWLAFATFCTLVFALVKFTVDFVNTAEVDQGARVTFSRGLALVTTPGTIDSTVLGSRQELGVGTQIAVQRKELAWVDLQLFDESKIKVLNGATLELTRMEIGRFINQHSLVLTQTSGPVRYATGGPIEVLVPDGPAVQLAPHGDYTVWLDGETTRVLVYGGEARVSMGSTSVNVAEGRMADVDAHGQIRQGDRQVPLLMNSDFRLHEQNWEPHDLPNSRLDINGTRSWLDLPEDIGGSGRVLRISRESVKSEHGETGLMQRLDRGDVSGFRHLWLRAMVRVDYADLSGGGQLGSEYPMDLQLNYEGPQAGSEIPWAVGFYYSNQDNRVIPPGRAVQWPLGEWQMYEVDLMNTEPSRIPYRLIDFKVMGQGHSYDARIANISLTGE